MTCKLNINAASARLRAAVGGVFPFPDAVRANTPAGRRAVSQFTMNVLTSDAALHQFRKDVAAAGITVTAEQNWVDSMGNLGNKIAAAQRRELNEYVEPITVVLERVLDQLKVVDAAARKTVVRDAGRYREALHAIERHAAFSPTKGKFVGWNAVEGSDARKAADKAAAERKALMRKLVEGELSAGEFTAQLDTITKATAIDAATTEDLGGMTLQAARAAVASYEADQNVVAVYNAAKPLIDRAFDRVMHIHERTGKIGADSKRLIELYGFQHYAPVYDAVNVDSLNEANFLDTVGSDVLNVAQGGIPGERIPFWAALHIQLNGAAKNYEENAVALRLMTFTKAHGKQFGLTNHGGQTVYRVTDTGHEVRRQNVPAFSVPYFNDGKMYWITVDQRDADGAVSVPNKQLFDAIKNRMTQQFYSSAGVVNTKVQRAITHLPARLFTNLNPMFWFNSLVRDPMSVGVNLMLDSRVPNKAEVARKALGYMVSEFNHYKAISHYMRKAERRLGARLEGVDATLVPPDALAGDTSTFARWVEDLASHGGEALFNRSFYSADYVGVATSGTDMQKLDAAVPLELGGSHATARALHIGAHDTAHKIMAWTGDLVTAFDMQARVSVYRALLETNPGMDKDAAAAIVREFMDFSQKPMESNVFNTLIPFFRTSTTAAYRTVDAMLYDDKGNLDPSKLKPIAGMIAAGFLWALASKGDDDDDGIPRGDKISHSRAFSSIVLGYKEDGSAVSIPVAYGAASLFTGLGVALERMTSGRHDPDDVLAAYSIHVAKNLAPLQLNAPDQPGEDVGTSVLHAITNMNPVTGQIHRLAANVDAFGNTLHSEAGDYNAGTTASLEGKATTPELFHDMAQHLYDYSGGRVDVYPETFMELLSAWTPFGAGRALTNELKREQRRGYGSVDEADWTPAWQHIIGGVFADRSPVFYMNNQYKKADAVYRDIRNRVELGLEVSPEAEKFYTEFDHYRTLIDRINGGMRGMGDAEKYEAVLLARQAKNLAAQVGIKWAGIAQHDLLRED